MKISIITVVWNGEATIADTIGSVLAQTWTDWEHIIVDGASTDGTLPIVNELRHDRMKLVSEPDAGIYDAMSKGLRMATGDLIGFLNADDYFSRTDSLELVAEAAASAPDADAISGALVLVDPNEPEKVIRTVRSRGYQRWMARFGVMLPHPSTYVRRPAVQAIGPFHTGYRISGDFDWFVRFFYAHGLTVRTIEDVVVVQRQGGVSTSGFPSMRIGNSEISDSLKRNGVASAPPLVWLKYIYKISQLWDRPKDYPASPGVSFSPTA